MSKHTSSTTDNDTSLSHGHDESFYIKTWVALLVLMVLSLVGSEIGAAKGLIGVTLVSAFGIAVVKAWLVIKNFMHIPAEKPVAAYVLIVCLACMGLLWAGVAPDIMAHQGSRWVNYAAISEVARVNQLAEQGVLDGHHNDANHNDAKTHGTAAPPAHNAPSPTQAH